MINLKSDKVLDKHLKPIKSGEDNTSLELASEDNGAKVKGDLDITGNINVGGKLVTTGQGGSSSATGTGSPNVDIESSNDIRLSSLNGAITFYKGNTVINEMQGMSSGFNLKMYPEDYSGNGTADFASINVGTNGELTISTTSLSDADITLVTPVGQIVSNSKHIFNHDIILDDADKLRLDGNLSGNTYIHEVSADKLEIVVGDIVMLTLDEANGRIDILADEIRLADEDSSTFSGSASSGVQSKAQIDTAIADGNIKISEVSINQLQMGALNSTEIELVPAQGAGKVVLPTSVTCFVDRSAGTAQANANCDLFVGYDGSTSSIEVCYYARRFMYNESGDRVMGLDRYGNEWGQSLTAGDNQPLTVKLDAAITTGSIDGMKVVTTYHVYDNS